MRVRIVLDPDCAGWILEKFADRLIHNLRAMRIEVDSASEPSYTADINHWIFYQYFPGKRTTIDTLMITHIDRPLRLHALMRKMREARVGICLSKMTMEDLLRRGIRRDQLCYINPPHDGLMKPRRIIIGITSKMK